MSDTLTVCRLFERTEDAQLAGILRASLGDPPQRPCRGVQKGENRIPPFCALFPPFLWRQRKGEPPRLERIGKISFLGEKTFENLKTTEWVIPKKENR